MANTTRTALLAGATGLVGRDLLSLLLANEHYTGVHVFVRRTPAELKVSPKLTIHEVDFARLPSPLPAADDAYIALGTTIKVAGSKEAFRQVDFDFVVNTARAAKAAGAKRLAVVSALGADPTSRIFYSRVKGEMETAVLQIGYETVVIAQPSMLLGDRMALGQPPRTGEIWAARLMMPLALIMPRDIRAIPARAVAFALITAMVEAQPGVRVLRSGAMQDIG